MIKGAIFDLDGTLLDSMWVWKEIDRRFLSKRGYEVPPDYSQAIAAMNFRSSAEYTVKRFSLKETPEHLMAEWMEMSRDIYANEIKLKPFAKEFLLRLKERGIKLAVATSSDENLYLSTLKNNEVYDLFSVIMDTSNTRSKAYPDVYLAVAQKIKLQPSECVVFEDIPVALKSAKSGGFKTVAIYDSHSHPIEDIAAITDYYAQGFEELLTFF